MLVLLRAHLEIVGSAYSLHALATADVDRHQSTCEGPTDCHRGILIASLDRRVLAHVRRGFAYGIGLPLHNHISLRLLALSILLIVRGALVAASCGGLMIHLLCGIRLWHEGLLIVMILRCILLLPLLRARALRLLVNEVGLSRSHLACGCST